jgi:hypothetical protein
MKKGTSKKRRREKKPKKEKKKIMSVEKSERDEKMDKCSTGLKNPPLRKRHKKEKNNVHVSGGE